MDDISVINGQKVMVETPDRAGKEVPVAMEAKTMIEDTYHDIAGNKVVQDGTTYSSRMGKLSEVLGNKGDANIG